MGIFKEKPKTEREKVEERRDEVLARGRKFKYPMQYAKHKLIINTIVIAVVAVVLMTVAGWAMLYRLQDTGDMLYRVTQIIPVPVAEVAGSKVRYSDYLMIYRSNLITAEQQGGELGSGADADIVREGYKASALEAAVTYTYALKLGKEMGIQVTEEEITRLFDEHRKVGGIDRSEEGFLKILKDNFGMNKSEYRRMLYLTIMKAKVSQAIDKDAVALADKVDNLLVEHEKNLQKVGEVLGKSVEFESTGNLVSNMNVDGGRSTAAMKLEVGEVSGRFLSSNGDGFYYVKLNNKTNSEVNYESIKINFSTFNERIRELYRDGQVKEYISLIQQ